MHELRSPSLNTTVTVQMMQTRWQCKKKNPFRTSHNLPEVPRNRLKGWGEVLNRQLLKTNNQRKHVWNSAVQNLIENRAFLMQKQEVVGL